ncbi:MAG TPA: sulfatase [Tepidisphaeraceae bacterium]|nr:sulfatase [Tepidisphaeraceae bacterium]
MARRFKHEHAGIILFILIFARALFAKAPATESTSHTNIVLLLADDLGWTDLHTGATCDGNGTSYHQTPFIDKLATQGMSFSSMYMCPNCAPSRAALMTGQYSPRNGVYAVTGLDRGEGILQPPVQSEFIRHDAITIANLLKSAGYTTCHVAKFHVSTHTDITKFDGFDFNYGGTEEGSPRGYFAVQDSTKHWYFVALGREMDQFALPYTRDYVEQNLLPYASGNDPLTLVGTPKHATDATADAAIQFMTRHLASPKDHDKPFFINIAFNAVHARIKSRPDLVAKYKRIKSSDPRHTRADYAALLEGEDQAIGRILHFLKEHNLRNNTLVIFVSDNGGYATSTSNAPLRGSKGMFYDGGLRVPMIVRLPGVIPAGTKSDAMLSVVDLYPTIADFAGVELPDPAKYKLDGESFGPVLRGQENHLHRSAIYYDYPGYLDTRAYPCAVIIKRLDAGRYKLLYSYEDEHYELYDLTADISEAHDLLQDSVSPASVTIAENLHDDLCNWLAEIHPLYPRYKSTGKVVPPPVPIKEALAAGNRIARRAYTSVHPGSD